MAHSKDYHEASEDIEQLKQEEDYLWDLLGKAWTRISEAEKVEKNLRKRHDEIKHQRELAAQRMEVLSKREKEKAIE